MRHERKGDCRIQDWPAPPLRNAKPPRRSAPPRSPRAQAPDARERLRVLNGLSRNARLAAAIALDWAGGEAVHGRAKIMRRGARRIPFRSTPTASKSGLGRPGRSRSGARLQCQAAILRACRHLAARYRRRRALPGRLGHRRGDDAMDRGRVVRRTARWAVGRPRWGLSATRTQPTSAVGESYSEVIFGLTRPDLPVSQQNGGGGE